MRLPSKAVTCRAAQAVSSKHPSAPSTLCFLQAGGQLQKTTSTAVKFS